MKPHKLIYRLIALVTINVISLNIIHSQEALMQEHGFVYLDEVLESAQYEVRYHSHDNFIGQPIDGYHSDRLVLTKEAAKALKAAEVALMKEGYCLKIFDTYRPQRAVNNFISWSKIESDTLMKAAYYPEQVKRQLFKLGYISTRSGHSRGSTIDLTIADIETGDEIDMGGPYDFFGEVSHHTYTDLSDTQLNNRKLLKKAMWNAGFRPYSKEWWHYTLNNEPYPKQYFDFTVPAVSKD